MGGVGGSYTLGEKLLVVGGREERVVTDKGVWGGIICREDKGVQLIVHVHDIVPFKQLKDLKQSYNKQRD